MHFPDSLCLILSFGRGGMARQLDSRGTGSWSPSGCSAGGVLPSGVGRLRAPRLPVEPPAPPRRLRWAGGCMGGASGGGRMYGGGRMEARRVPAARHYLTRSGGWVLQYGQFCAGGWRPSGCSTIHPAAPSRRMVTQRGHALLEFGGGALRPVAFGSGGWKPFWMLTGDSAGNLAACGQNPRLLPRPLPRSARRLR